MGVVRWSLVLICWYVTLACILTLTADCATGDMNPATSAMFAPACGDSAGMALKLIIAFGAWVSSCFIIVGAR